MVGSILHKLLWCHFWMLPFQQTQAGIPQCFCCTVHVQYALVLSEIYR